MFSAEWSRYLSQAREAPLRNELPSGRAAQSAGRRNAHAERNNFLATLVLKPASANSNFIPFLVRNKDRHGEFQSSFRVLGPTGGQQTIKHEQYIAVYANTYQQDKYTLVMITLSVRVHACPHSHMGCVSCSSSDDLSCIAQQERTIPTRFM